MNEFVLIPNNPVPEFAETFYFHDDENNKMRGLFARASSKFSSPRGTAIVCPGRTEPIEKHFEVIRDLQDRGFCVVAFDWPGQGLSFRLLDDPLAGYIDSFDRYIEALQRGLNVIEEKLEEGPRVVLAHSMGGAIALEAIRRQVLDVDAAAFCAPMWGLKIAKVLHPLVPIMCKLGFSQKIVRGHTHNETFKNNIISNYEPRWRIQQDLNAKNPEIALGEVTWGWVREALSVSKGFAKAKSLEHLHIPMMVASAQEEALVDNNTHNSISKRIKSMEHINVAGAKHEILMETDARRERFFVAFDKMLDRAGV